VLKGVGLNPITPLNRLEDYGEQGSSEGVTQVIRQSPRKNSFFLMPPLTLSFFFDMIPLTSIVHNIS
jgi:hypothetical protein